MPIAEWLDDPSNGFENGDSQSRIDLLREPGPTCREVGKICEKGLLFSLDSGVGEGVCQPDRLELHIKQDELSGSYSVSWLPSIPPENYTGTSYYEISYQESGSSDWFLETVPGALSGGTSLDVNLTEGHGGLVFKGRACRDDGVCSEWSDESYPVYPLQRPYGVTFDPVSKQLEWNYEPQNSFETGEGIFFEISPLFPVFDPAVVDVANNSPWSYTVENSDDWPGRIATIRACREVSSEGTDCGPDVEVRMEEAPVDETIHAPQSVLLTGSGGANGKYSLSWQPVDNERVTHYKVRETVNSNQGQRQNHFAVEADQFDIFRFAVDSSADYEVAACQKDRENGDRCSDYTSVDNGASVDPPSSYNLGPIERLCWEHVHGHETPKDDNNGIYYAAVRLRWKYNTEAHDAPEQFIGWYNTPFGFEYGRHTDPTLKFSQLTPGVNGQHYWKSSEAGPGRLSQPGLSVGTSPDGISSSYTIKAAIPKAGSGDEWITGPESFEITPLKWDLAKGEPKWDTDTKCKDSDWPTQSSNKPAGGPGALVPGHWITRADGANADDPALGMVNGWRFYWTSGIDYDPASGTFGLSYDLLAFWYTYQLIDGEWSPVWLYSRMQADNGTKGDYAEGALIYPVKDGLDEVVGNVRIYFNDPDDKSSSPVDNHQHAWVDLSVNAGNGLNKNSQFRIMDFLLDEDYFEPGGFGHPNQSQHYRGVWIEGDKALFDDQGRILQSSNLIMSEWADTSMTSMTIQSFDDHGLPIWFIHFDCNQNGPGTKCDESYRPDISESQTVKAKDFHTYHPAIDPFFIAKDAQEETSASNSLVLAEPSGQGVVRQLKNAPLDSSSSSYDPKLDLTQGLLCAGFDDQFGSRGFNVQLGSSNCNKSNIAIAGAKISKIANFHDIDFVLPNADSPEEQTACDLSESAGQDYCKLLLTWFTDDYNPNAQPMYSTATDGANLRHINDLCIENTGTEFDFAVVQLECTIKDENIAESETFRFHLVNNPLPGGGFDEGNSAIIATSRPLKVTGGTEVPIETPPDVVIDTPPNADLASSQVGSTGGEFKVSHIGAAEYSIPVMAAPGTGGVSPEISLSYSSMVGNGPMGAGWNISGFSAITRCGQTYEQDDFTTGVTLTTEDRFCLDGQRLIQTVGAQYGEPESQYRLEVDTFVRITAKGNAGGFPQYFIVEGKDGSSSIFGSFSGSGTSSVTISDSSSSAIYAWPIEKFEDSTGNYIEYEYYQPGRNNSSPWIEWLPKSAHYTGNQSAGVSPYASIELEYSQLDPEQMTSGYVAGASINQTQLLRKVKSSTGEKLLREYRIAYTSDAHGRHLVESVKECWGAGNTDCYKPLAIEWYSGVPEFKESHPAHNIVSFDDFKGAISGDLSGDGKDELLIIKSVGNKDYAGVDVIENNGSDTLNLSTNTSLSEIEPVPFQRTP